jgi:fumarylacetoacetate (FAA) hydrolase
MQLDSLLNDSAPLMISRIQLVGDAMKLGSLKRGRDGALIVVSRDLTRGVEVPKIAATMQRAVDEWSECRPRLEAVYEQLNAGNQDGCFELNVDNLAAPFPRAYQFADGSAYVRHVELVRRARGAVLPDSYWSDPLIYQAGSDGFMGPNDPIFLQDESFGIDFEAELVGVTDDVPMGTKEHDANQHFILFMLINDVSLRNLIPAELKKEFGFFQGKSASTLSPVAVTPDEFGDAWNGETLDLAITSTLRGELFGQPKVSVDQTFTLNRLLEHCAKTRKLGAGTLIGTGTISNATPGAGFSCIAEVRAVETIEKGAPETSFMKFGDRIRIEMFRNDRTSIFGAIDQTVERYELGAA